MRSFFLAMLVLYVGISLVVVSSSHADRADPAVHEAWEYKVVHASSFVSVKDLLGKCENAIGDFEKKLMNLARNGGNSARKWMATWSLNVRSDDKPIDVRLTFLSL